MTEKRKDSYYIRTAIIIMMLIVIVVCLIVMVSPQIAAKQEEDMIHQDISLWQERIVQMPEPQPTTGDPEVDATAPTEYTMPYAELYEAMVAYNEEIFLNGQKDLEDAWSYQADVFDLEDYGIDSEIAAVVTIPRLGVEMPLYLGATWNNLNEGFAQLSQTSMPIGGSSTNCVIAGHRGWRNMDFLINIERLQIGDSIYIQNYWETLEYRVCEVQIIYPYEVEKIHIQPGRDLITFVTCHPYRVNTHRYVVFCERYIPEETSETTPATEGENVATEPQTPTVEWANRITITSSDGIDFESSQMLIFLNTKLPWILLAVSFVLILLAIVIIIRRSKRNR